MKTMRTILSACCLTAMAFASCQQYDEPANPTSNMRSINVSLKNAVITRGYAGDIKIEKNTPVNVKNFKIFLTDEYGNEYSAKSADGSEDAQTWWSTADLASQPLDAQFHYVDPKCTKVVAVANIDSDMTFAEYQSFAKLLIGAEQNAQDLTLYDAKDLQGPINPPHTDINANGTTYVSDVYKADLVLKPRISRFEVDGFRVNFSPTPKYETIEIKDILFQNYYPETDLKTGVESGTIVNHIADLANQSTVYNWFNDTTKASDWYFDSFSLTIKSTDANPAKDTPTPLAYHMFSCNTSPVMVIRLLADGQPAYLYSKGFYSATEVDSNNNAKKIENFEEGKIYRMSAPGINNPSDGSIPIDDTKIDPMDRCLEISVDVLDWTVDLVYPEF